MSAPPDRMIEELHHLKNMSAENLRSLWLKTHGRPSPMGWPRDLLLRALCFHHQEVRFGGLNKDSQKVLRAYERGGASHIQLAKTGSVIVREYQGQMHEVTIATDGFIWRGKTYSSLSHVAREITGTNWSGPRFFGLMKSRKEVAV